MKWKFVPGALLGALGFLIGLGLAGLGQPLPPLPTLAVMPSDTATARPTATPSATPSATATLTATATATLTATATFTPSATPTLATRVLYVTALNAGVTPWQPPTPTIQASPTPLPTVDVPVPGANLPIAGLSTPVLGWMRYESADPALQYTAGRWFRYRADRASARGYSYSADLDARVSLTFVGSGVRVRYVGYALYGVFQVRIDGKIAAEIDSYSPRPAFLASEVFRLTHGPHTLEIVNTGRKHPASTGYLVALDSIEVYRGVLPTDLPTASPAPTLTVTPSPAKAEVRLIAGPPTMKATVTPIPPAQIAVTLVIAYDENGNRSVEPAEGVQGISVRLVAVGTNQVIASGFTNGEGFVRLEVVTDEAVRLVVPYFGRFWNVSARSGESTFSLLLPPANQPGLIP